MRARLTRSQIVETVILFVQIVSGAVGGLAVGGGLREQHPAVALDTVLGIIGGIGAGQLINALGFGTGPLDVLTLLINMASGGAGGAALAFFVVAIRVLITR